MLRIRRRDRAIDTDGIAIRFVVPIRQEARVLAFGVLVLEGRDIHVYTDVEFNARYEIVGNCKMVDVWSQG